MTILTIVCVSVIQSKLGLYQNLMYGFASPIAGLLISIVFGFIIVNRKKMAPPVLIGGAGNMLQARIGKNFH